jgi:SAM-dependent methyltransferase
MAEFHFVEDYERHAAHLIKNHPLDEAVSLAIGGGYEEFGRIEADILRYAGLKDGMSLIDLGCGSGRLATVLGRTMKIEYTGIDIVQALLDYAESKSPALVSARSPIRLLQLGWGLIWTERAETVIYGLPMTVIQGTRDSKSECL